ncbi:MAG: FAD-dependent oxidoreductase [Patescibacteria group bacterium]|jgi:protoporphyrinogen oxidase
MTKHRVKVAIVGGGILGLVAAYRILKDREDNAEVTLFEKEKFLGGQASCVDIQGCKVEKLYHHFFSGDDDLLSLVRELGLEKRIIWGNTKIGVFSNGKIYPFSTPGEMLRLPLLNIISRARFAAFSLYLKVIRFKGTFDKVSAYEWINKYYGKQVYKYIWGPLLEGKFHKFYRNVSMVWFHARVHKRSNSRSGVEEQLWYLDGGMDLLIKELENGFREMGGKVLVSSEVERITYVKSLDCVEISYSGIVSSFDEVICAVSSSVFSSLVRNAVDKIYERRLKSIDYVSVLCLLFTSRKDLTEYYWINMCDKEMPFSVFIQHTNFIDKSKYKGLNVYYVGMYLDSKSGLYGKEDHIIFSKIMSSITKMFPDFCESDVVDYNVSKFIDAQHVVDKGYSDKLSVYNVPLPHVYLVNFAMGVGTNRDVNNAVKNGMFASKVIFGNQV